MKINQSIKKPNFDEVKTNIRRMIVISYCAHSLYKQFWFLRSRKMVGQTKAESNVKIYKDFGSVFSTFEESCLTSFTVIFNQLFDKRSDVFSLYYLNSKYGKNYENKIDKLRNSKEAESIIKLRHKFFAHKDNSGQYIDRIVLSSNSIEKVYRQICDLYGEITGENILIHDTSADDLHSLFELIRKSNPGRFKI